MLRIRVHLHSWYTVACASWLINAVVTPLDVVKVRMQSQVRPTAYVFHGDFFDNVEPCSARSRLEAVKRPPIRGTFAGMRYIVENEGLHHLWRGLSPTLYLLSEPSTSYSLFRMMAIPATVVYFVGYESMRNRLLVLERLPAKDALAPLLAGSSARILAATMISPLELIRTNMQHQGPDGTASSVLRQVMQACRAQGLRALFKGLVPTLWRDVPFSAIYWTSFEQIRYWLRPYVVRQRDTLSSGRTSEFTLKPGYTSESTPSPGCITESTPSSEFALSFAAGAMSGALAATATTPFDVAKTRTQIQIDHFNSEPVRMIKQVMTIWREEGISGLSRGLAPRVFKVAPACAIMIGSYEFGKAFFSSSIT